MTKSMVYVRFSLTCDLMSIYIGTTTGFECATDGEIRHGERFGKSTFVTLMYGAGEDRVTNNIYNNNGNILVEERLIGENE